MAKHLDTRELTPNFARGERHCKRVNDGYSVMYNDDYDKAVKYHYCCHGGHGKRKINVANYVRSIKENQS